MTPSEHLRLLADKIDKNAPEDFAGCFIIVPPSGDSISGLLIGQADLGVFWGAVKTKLDIAVNTISDAERQRDMMRR